MIPQCTKLFVLAILFLSSLAFGQARERVKLNYESLTKASDLEVSTMTATVNHRFNLDDEGASLLTIGVTYRDQAITDDQLAQGDESFNLQSVMPLLSWMNILNEKNTLIVLLRPGFFGDFEEDFGRSFRLEGGVVINQILSETFTLGVGVGRGANLGRDFWVPLVQFLYFPSTKWMIDGLLPTRAGAWYLHSANLEYGLVFNLRGSLYDIARMPGSQVASVGFAAGTLGAAIRYRLGSKIFLYGELGMTFTRRYEYVRTGGPIWALDDPSIVTDRDLDNVAYGSFGAEWQF